MTATLEQPRAVPRTPALREEAEAVAPSGAAAALVVCGWILASDRWTDPYYVWTSLAALLALVLFLRPIAWRGLVRRACLAPFQIAATVLVLFTGDRALAAWEERSPAFAAASTISATALNVVGYRTAVERGLLLVDHPDGLVTIASSIEKLALRPFLLFWFVWVVLRLSRFQRQIIVCSLVSLAVTLLVALARYVALLAVYLEHDDILSGGAGQAALDIFASPWITCGFLVAAGVAADRACRIVSERAPAPTAAAPRLRTVAGASVMVAVLSAAGSFAWLFVPPGAMKAGRILIDDRFCGIWEPTARQLDTEWYGDFPTYSFTSLVEWLGSGIHRRHYDLSYDDDLLYKFTPIIKTPEEPIPMQRSPRSSVLSGAAAGCCWSATTPTCSAWARTSMPFPPSTAFGSAMIPCRTGSRAAIRN